MSIFQRMSTMIVALGLVVGFSGQVHGTAIDMDASGDYVAIPDSPSLSPTQQLTMEGWVRFDSHRPEARVVVGKYQGNSGRSYMLQVVNGGLVRALISHDGSSGNTMDLTSTEGVSTGTWNHVAATYDGAVLKLYLNGIEVGSMAGTGGIDDNPLSVHLGLFGPANLSFDGELDEVRIWSVARTAAEIRQGMFIELAGNETGLEGYWKFADQDGRDYTANGNDGSINGDPAWTQPGFPQPRGMAIDLDASGDYVEIPDSPSLSPTQQLTLEAWIRPRGGANLIMKHQGDAGGGGRSFVFQANFDGSLRVVISHDGSAGNAIDASSGGGFFSMNVWSHVATTYDGSTLRFYVNGIEIGSASGTGGIYDGTLPVRIGLFTTNNPSFNGEVDEVRIWDIALTQEELRQGMFTTLNGDESGLGGYWRFEDQDGRDYTANGNNGAVNGDPAWVEGAPEVVDIGSVPVAVSLPVTTTTYLASLDIPVSIGNTSGLGVVSAELFVTYDGDLLIPTATPVSRLGMTTGWTLEYNIEQGNGTPIDTIKVAMADEAALTGSGDIAMLHFTVTDQRSPAYSDLGLTHVLLNDGTPPAITIDGSVTLVGNTATIETDVTEIIPREPITVTVTDADADVTGGVDQITVQVVNVDNGDVVSLTIDETAATSGQFIETVDTEFGAVKDDGDEIIQAQADDLIEFRFVDALDDDGNGPETRIASVTAKGGNDGSIQVSVVTQPGDLLYIEVVDADLTIAGLTDVAVLVETDGGDNENVTLDAVAGEADVFFGQITTTPSAGVDGELTTAKGVAVTVTYDDVVTQVGDQVNRTATSSVVDPFGDVDGNGLIQAYDASLVLQSLLSNPPVVLTGLDLLSADVADDFGAIIPLDAAHILKKVVGLLPVFEVQEAGSLNHPQGVASPKRMVEERLLALRVGEGYVSLWAEDLSGIVSGEVVLEGVFGRMELGEELSDFLSVSGADGKRTQVLFAGAESVTGPGELLRVYTGVGPGSVQLTRAVFNDGSVVGYAGEMHFTPQGYVLYGNVPNPFNPETVIRYGLPVESEVVLEVYDALGQQVKVLVSGVRSAGDHEVMWDGRNEMGGLVSSGVYFYRLRAGEGFSQMRRMLLLK